MKTLLQIRRNAQLYKEHIKLFCFTLRTAELESEQFNHLITRKSKTFTDKPIRIT
jgi:hypothetical protein